MMMATGQEHELGFCNVHDGTWGPDKNLPQSGTNDLIEQGLQKSQKTTIFFTSLLNCYDCLQPTFNEYHSYQYGFVLCQIFIDIKYQLLYVRGCIYISEQSNRAICLLQAISCPSSQSLFCPFVWPFLSFCYHHFHLLSFKFQFK